MDDDAYSGILPADPAISPVTAAGLSLLLPGAGQWYLGQRWRGASLFVASAAVCFGLGLCNLLISYDAWSLANRRQTEDITYKQSSKTLLALDAVLALVRGALQVAAGLVKRIPVIGPILAYIANPTKIGG